VRGNGQTRQWFLLLQLHNPITPNKKLANLWLLSLN
jgi:hypothetical protein